MRAGNECSTGLTKKESAVFKNAVLVLIVLAVSIVIAFIQVEMDMGLRAQEAIERACDRMQAESAGTDDEVFSACQNTDEPIACTTSKTGGVNITYYRGTYYRGDPQNRQPYLTQEVWVERKPTIRKGPMEKF